MFVFTVSPPITMLPVKSPSTLSVAVAPNSVYVSPTLRLTVAEPFNVMTGASVSGPLPSIITV